MACFHHKTTGNEEESNLEPGSLRSMCFSTSKFPERRGRGKKRHHATSLYYVVLSEPFLIFSPPDDMKPIAFFGGKNHAIEREILEGRGESGNGREEGRSAIDPAHDSARRAATTQRLGGKLCNPIPVHSFYWEGGKDVVRFTCSRCSVFPRVCLDQEAPLSGEASHAQRRTRYGAHSTTHNAVLPCANQCARGSKHAAILYGVLRRRVGGRSDVEIVSSRRRVNGSCTCTEFASVHVAHIQYLVVLSYLP